MVVKGVEDVGYDELGEIELANGELDTARFSSLTAPGTLLYS